MKKIAIRITTVLMAIFLYGCPNDGPYHMYTKISPDGSCYREFILSVDSIFAAGDTSKNPFPMKIDSTWEMTFYKRFADDTSRYANFPAGNTYIENGKEYSWIATAKKEFASVDKLAISFRYDNSEWDSVVPEISFDKKFRWFYTYFEFIETYKPVNSLNKIPISEYMTDKEIGALYGEDRELYKGKNGYEVKSLLENLEKKSDEWLNRNFFEEIYTIYINHFDSFKGVPIDAANFALEKDTVYKYYFSKDTVDVFRDFNDMLDHHFHTHAFTLANKEFDQVLEQELPSFFKHSLEEVNYRLSLPGKIIETNAPFLNQDTLSWKVDDERFYFQDYPLNATSRKPNYWAFAVTAVVVILAVLGLWVRRD
jgi:hypothetical protein